MAKFRIKAGHEQEAVCTAAPEYRNGNGRFVLCKCSQRDLRYLYEVAKYPFVELVDDEQKATEQTEG